MRTALVLTAFTLMSCMDSIKCKDAEPVKIKLKNTGTVNFIKVEISYNDTGAVFENIAPGEETAFKTFGLAYSYGYVEATTAEKVYKLVPIDYVGECPIPKGEYRINLKVEEGILIAESLMKL